MEVKRQSGYFRDLVYLEKSIYLLSVYVRQLKMQISRLEHVQDENNSRVSDMMLEAWREKRMLYVSAVLTGSIVIWVLDRGYVLRLFPHPVYRKLLSQDYILREFITSVCAALFLSACIVCGCLFLSSLLKKCKRRSKTLDAAVIEEFPVDWIESCGGKMALKSYLSEQRRLAADQYSEMYITFFYLRNLCELPGRFDNPVDRFLISQYFLDRRCTDLKGKSGAYALLLKDANRKRAKKRMAKGLLPEEIPALEAEINEIRRTIGRMHEENRRIFCSGKACENMVFSALRTDFERERQRIEADMPIYTAEYGEFRKNSG